MKKLILSCVFITLCFSTVAAQNAVRYHLDNFDLGGVRVEVPQPSVAVSSHKLNVKLKNPVKLNTSLPEAKLKRTAYAPYKANRTSTETNRIGTAGNFTTGDAKIDSYIVESGMRHGVDPTLLYAIMHQESSFKPRAVSYKGAAGLMQLMPGTAARFGIRDRFNPRESVEGGARYMRFLLDFFGGSVPLALAGYNAGEGAVLRYGRRVPPYRETQDYVSRISRRYNLLRDPHIAHTAPRATLQEIAVIEKVGKEPVAIMLTTPVYERAVYAVRMPDGNLRLVSQ